MEREKSKAGSQGWGSSARGSPFISFWRLQRQWASPINTQSTLAQIRRTHGSYHATCPLRGWISMTTLLITKNFTSSHLADYGYMPTRERQSALTSHKQAPDYRCTYLCHFVAYFTDGSVHQKRKCLEANAGRGREATHKSTWGSLDRQNKRTLANILLFLLFHLHSFVLNRHHDFWICLHRWITN